MKTELEKISPRHFFTRNYRLMDWDVVASIVDDVESGFYRNALFYRIGNGKKSINRCARNWAAAWIILKHRGFSMSVFGQAMIRAATGTGPAIPCEPFTILA